MATTCLLPTVATGKLQSRGRPRTISIESADKVFAPDRWKNGVKDVHEGRLCYGPLGLENQRPETGQGILT